LFKEHAIKTPLKKSDMIFIFPHFGGSNRFSFSLDYHLGTSYIMAYLKERGIKTSQFVNYKPIDLHRLTEKILRQKSKIVGFTCYDDNYYVIKLISQLLKAKDPSTTILVGGPTATFSSQLILEDNYAFDICVRGEGEQTVYELLNSSMESHSLKNIKGVTYRINGKLYHNPDRELIQGDQLDSGLDILPSPYLNNILPQNKNMGILTSRGCVFRCTFCNFSALSRWTVRYHSVERVISELKKIHENNRNEKVADSNEEICIYDDTFALNPKFAKDICRRLIEEEIRLSLWTELRADIVDRELLELMYQAGFRQINYGLESAVPKVLRNIKKAKTASMSEKNLKPEKKYIAQIEQNIIHAKNIGLRPTVSVIFGLPGATKKEDQKTLEFVRNLDVDLYYDNHLQIFPGTELFETHKKHGLNLVKSAKTLPYLTEHRYDVRTLPQMKNSWHEIERKSLLKRIQRLVTGIYEDISGSNYPDVLFKGKPTNDSWFKWLRNNLAISSLIVFLTSSFEEGDVAEGFERMFFSGVPISDFISMTPLDKYGRDSFSSKSSNGLFEIALNHKDILGVFRFLPLGKIHELEFASAKQRQKYEQFIIFTLSHKDLANFVSYEESNIFALNKNLGKVNACLLDECRWSDYRCPAMDFRRAIIEEDGTILPCTHGNPIGRIGNERNSIIKTLQRISAEVEETRGCKSCDMEDECPKCLFPHPIDSDEYCQIIKKIFYLRMENKKALRSFFKNVSE